MGCGGGGGVLCCRPTALGVAVEAGEWGEFLLVPAAAIRLLPQILLSSDTNGCFKISWLHKVYCLTVTRFLVMFVNLMSPKFWKS